IILMADLMMDQMPMLFGVATVENAFEKVANVEVLTPEVIEERETELQKMAKQLLPKINFDKIDVHVIDKIAKTISGDAMDQNITGRYPTPYAHGGPDVNKMVVLDLTPETEGNANGVGTADFTTQRLIDKTDWDATYANGLTSTVVAPTKAATTLKNDELALKAAVKTCNILDFTTVKMVRIKNTLELSEIEVSEELIPEVEANDALTQVSDLYELAFDEEGNLV